MNTTTKYGLLAVLALAVILGGVYYFRTPALAPTTAATSEAKTFTLTVQNRKVVGASTLTVKQGDTVSITITADEADELHLHGYDKSVEFEPSVPATLTFVADHSGRFPFEMEGSKTDLGEVDVQP